ncbi:hypothetical protein D3C76_1758060 [compost metagenome]
MDVGGQGLFVKRAQTPHGDNTRATLQDQAHVTDRDNGVRGHIGARSQNQCAAVWKAAEVIHCSLDAVRRRARLSTTPVDAEEVPTVIDLPTLI